VEIGTYSNTSLVFDLLILDIDGVMTDGRKLYDDSGQGLFKQFCDKDFTAIKRFKANGINVCFLSADKQVNATMAKVRNIDFIYARSVDGTIDKSRFLDQLRQKYDSTRVCFVGDDYYDLTLLSDVDISFCPSDAAEIVKRNVTKVLDTRGGEGVVAELFSIIFEGRNEIFASDSI
jgi:3-deoxy-D-manno-octulosonate 8-phosphate phosphatase (KDO 8-P phosphatase)